MESGLRELCLERLGKAHLIIDEAEYNINGGMLYGASNRIYYAIFNAVRAVNATEGFDSSKHSGVIAYFTKNFLKTGKLDGGLYDNIKDAFKLRERSDYEDFFVPDEEEVKKQLQSAKEFISAVDGFLSEFFSQDRNET